MAMNPATMAEGDVSVRGRSCVCVASVMTGVFLIHMKISESTLNPVGAGLLAKAVYQAISMLTVPPSSRASHAPTGDCVQAADSAFKPKLKSNRSLQYSEGVKQPYSRVA